MKNNKTNSNKVYGNTFKRYSKKEIAEFVVPFKIRFKKNKINSKKLFKNKNCLDLGCGNGRGGLFMAMNNAKEITFSDVSKININKSKSVLKSFGYKSTAINSPAEKIPFRKNTFDFVWCNGVIMHTDKPSSVLKEIYRVLKPDGQSWIYVYGTGGLWWCIINLIRKYLKNIKPEQIIKELRSLNYGNRFIAEYLDDWKVKNLRRYENASFTKALKLTGFKKVKKMNRGLNYDSSEKLHLTKNKILYGNGDLRYLITKGNRNEGSKNLIKFLDSFKENKYQEFNKYSNIFKYLFTKNRNSVKTKIKLAAYIQFVLRKQLNKKKFSEKVFYNFLKSLG